MPRVLFISLLLSLLCFSLVYTQGSEDGDNPKGSFVDEAVKDYNSEPLVEPSVDNNEEFIAGIMGLTEDEIFMGDDDSVMDRDDNLEDVKQIPTHPMEATFDEIDTNTPSDVNDIQDDGAKYSILNEDLSIDMLGDFNEEGILRDQVDTDNVQVEGSMTDDIETRNNEEEALNDELNTVNNVTMDSSDLNDAQDTIPVYEEEDEKFVDNDFVFGDDEETPFDQDDDFPVDEKKEDDDQKVSKLVPVSFLLLFVTSLAF